MIEVPLSSKRYTPIVVDLDNKNHSHGLIIDMIGKNKNVMEIGTSTGYISKILTDRGNKVIGVEIDSEAAEIASQSCEMIIKGDIECIDLDNYLEPSSFDVIVCADVLEHLKYPGKVLLKIKKYLKDDGYIVVSLPNVCHGDVLLNLIRGEFRYTPTGLLDKTHLRFFGLKNIITLFNDCGYLITDLHTTKLPVGSTELKVNKNEFPELLLNFIEKIPNTSVYQYVFKAIPSENSSMELNPETNIEILFNGLMDEIIESHTEPLFYKLSSLNEKLEKEKKESQEMGQQIASLNEKLEKEKNKSKKMEQQISEMEQQISEMEQSILFQLTMSFHKGFVERVFPINTRRRQVYDIGLQSGRTLVNKGFRNLKTDIHKDNNQKKEVDETKDEGKAQNVKFEEIGIDINLSKNPEKSKFSELASKYIRGKGIQIGPMNKLLDIPNNVSITNIDASGTLRKNSKSSVEGDGHDHSGSNSVELHSSDKESSFDEFENELLDFCIVTDIIEQVASPENILNYCLNILKPGGILYLIVSEGIDTKANRQIGLQSNIKIENLDNHKANYQSRKYTVENILDRLRSKEPDLFKVIHYIDDEVEGEKLHVFVIEKDHFVKKIFESLMARKTNQLNNIELDIIIPVYNAYEDLIKCLRSVLIHQEGARIILINDKSTDSRINDFFLKLKSFESKNLVLLENSENQGFVKTVNIGMKFSKNDVILLNSDTIVTKNWICKLRECASTDDKIGTVTPFTNNGTICSIPNFCEVNEVPTGFSIDFFADFIEKISLKKYPEIPTAVGFCMYIKREILDKIGYFDEEAFGKGYGEENDFCMRAIYAGYKNVLCDDTFIFHRGEASFSASKAELAKKNLDTLSKMYPEYVPAVSKFIHSNPLKKLHENIQSRIQTWDISKKKLMYILHTWGGGTENHVKDLIRNLNKTYILYVLQVINNQIILTEINNDKILKYVFNINSQINTFDFHNKEYEKIVSKIIDTFQIDLIHVHHLIGHSFNIFDIAKIRNVPVIFSIHDFYSVCPRINLIDYEDKYCHGNNNLTECEICYRNFGLNSIFFTSWRNKFKDIFEKTALLITPSKSTLDILSTYYPNIDGKSTVIEHGHNEELLISKSMIKKSRDIRNRPIHIAFIGALSPIKGKKIFYDLADSKELRGKTKWSIFGFSDTHFKSGYYQDLHVTIYGKYNGFQELRKMILENEVDLVMLPSKCPETFSFTLSEAWALGIPVLVSNLGSLKGRVEKNGGGWVVDVSETKNIENKILEIISNPQEFMAKTNEILNVNLKDIDSMIFEYDAVYRACLKSTNSLHFSHNAFNNTDLFKHIFTKNIRTSNQNSNVEVEYSENLPRRLVKCYKDNGFNYTVNRTYNYTKEKIRYSLNFMK